MHRSGRGCPGHIPASRPHVRAMNRRCRPTTRSCYEQTNRRTGRTSVRARSESDECHGETAPPRTTTEPAAAPNKCGGHAPTRGNGRLPRTMSIAAAAHTTAPPRPLAAAAAAARGPHIWMRAQNVQNEANTKGEVEVRDSSNSLPRDSSNSLPRDVPPFVHEAI